jgi:hypothetical protein
VEEEAVLVVLGEVPRVVAAPAVAGNKSPHSAEQPQKEFTTEAQRGGAAKESQKAKGKTQKAKVKGRNTKTYGEWAT